METRLERGDVDREMSGRLADYFKREHLSDADADRHAFGVLSILGAPNLEYARSLLKNWWVVLLRGVLAIVFGILALIQPLSALAALVLVFGVWALVDGVHALVLAISGRARSWMMVLSGIAGIALGLFTFFRPGITALGLYAAVAAWSIARGVFEIVMAIEVRKEIEGEGWLIFGGIVSILFGVLLIVLPASGVLALGWLVGIYALTYGVITSVVGFRLRGLREQLSVREVKPPLVTPTPHPSM